MLLQGFIGAGRRQSGWLYSAGSNIIPSATMLYDASQDSTIDAGTENWTGLIGGVATRVGITVPVWRPVYIDARESVLFEGESGQRYVLPIVLSAIPFTVVFSATSQPNSAEPNGAVFCASASGVANNFFSVGVESNNWVIRARQGGNNISSGTVAQNGELQTIVAEFTDNTTRRIRVNGGAWEAGAGASTPGSIDQSFLGQLAVDGGHVSAFNGEVHRVAIFSQTLTDEEATQAENWCNIGISALPDRDGDGYFRRDGNGDPMITIP